METLGERIERADALCAHLSPSVSRATVWKVLDETSTGPGDLAEYLHRHKGRLEMLVSRKRPGEEAIGITAGQLRFFRAERIFAQWPKEEQAKYKCLPAFLVQLPV